MHASSPNEEPCNRPNYDPFVPTNLSINAIEVLERYRANGERTTRIEIEKSREQTIGRESESKKCLRESLDDVVE